MRETPGDQWLAALSAALAAFVPAAALALSIGVADAADMALDALVSGALAEASGGVLPTSSFLLQPPRATCEARATTRTRDRGIERFMTDSS